MNINRVVLTGNLTQDPDLRSLPSGAKVCRVRIASSTRRRGPDGQWEDKPNYVDVRVWGAQGEACARFLSPGRSIAVDGRLEWREFEGRGRPEASGGRDRGRHGRVPRRALGRS